MSTMFRSIHGGPVGNIHGFTAANASKAPEPGAQILSRIGFFDVISDWMESLEFPHIPESPGIESFTPLRAPDVRTTSLLGGDT